MIETVSLATFGAGCFWGVETSFRHLPGVTRTSVGFMGGWTDNPTYDLVCVGNTGHAEVVQIRFDRTITSYDGLLNCFWSIHDPTTWGRQVPDTGSQYRSVIFYHSDEQQDLALASKEKAQTGHGETIATEIASAGAYYLAETYHQQYEEKRMRRHRSD